MATDPNAVLEKLVDACTDLRKHRHRVEVVIETPRPYEAVHVLEFLFPRTVATFAPLLHHSDSIEGAGVLVAPHVRVRSRVSPEAVMSGLIDEAVREVLHYHARHNEDRLLDALDKLARVIGRG